jgi:hypothetical protein
MMKSPIFLAALFFLLCGAPAAGLPSAPAADFASPPLGAEQSTLPRGLRRLGDCQVSHRYTDCEFEARDGLRYTVFGTIVTRKRIFLRDAGPRAMPFGIVRTDTLRSVLDKIRRRTGLRLSPGHDRAWAATFLTARRESVDLYVDFDRAGRPTEIGVTMGETG